MGNRQSGSFSDFMDYNGSFYNIIEKVFDVIAMSIYFIIGSLPVVTMGASFCALYYTATTNLRQDRKTVTRAFWHSYKQNLVESVKLWLIVLGAMFIFLLNIGILNAKMFNNVGIGFMVFYAICFVAVLAIACYAFPALSRFEEPAGWIVKLSLYLTVRHFPTTMLLLAILAGCYVAIFRMPLLILLLPGAVSLLSTFFVEPILAKHLPEK